MRYSSITHNKDIFTPLFFFCCTKTTIFFSQIWPKKISMPKLYYENKNIKNNILPGVISRTNKRTAAALLHLYHVMSGYICIYRVVDLSMCGRTDVQRCRRYMSVFVDKTYHFLLFYDSKKLLKQANRKQIQQQQKRRLAPASPRYNKNNNHRFCCRLLST